MSETFALSAINVNIDDTKVKIICDNHLFIITFAS